MTGIYAVDGEDAFLEAAYEDLTHTADDGDGEDWEDWMEDGACGPDCDGCEDEGQYNDTPGLGFGLAF